MRNIDLKLCTLYICYHGIITANKLYFLIIIFFEVKIFILSKINFLEYLCLPEHPY